LEGEVETALHDRLIARFEPVLQGLGYELVEVEFAPGPGGGTLRIYIDKPPEAEQGIDVEDCADVSHVLSELLDAEDPFPGRYSLEVSSPGTDRVLRTPEHFARFVDNRVKVELLAPRDGRKRYTGMLRRADAESIEMDVDNFSVSIRLAEISRARLAPL
jgi:ribosome maturation factor RimP